MTKTRVCLLDSGTLALEGYKLFWGRGSAQLIRFACYSVLIDHKDGLFLFDSGYDGAFMDKWTPQDNAVHTPEQTIPAQFAKLGIRFDEVKCILNSHLHIDHVGGFKYFPGVPMVVHEKEYEAAKNPMPFEYQSYSDLSFDPELHRLNFEGPRDILHRAGTDETIPAVTQSPKYQFVKGDFQFAEGIWLFETPGHSLGHMSLMVEVEGRAPMLFPADACHLPRHLEEMIVPGFHVDPVAGYRTLEKVKTIQKERGAEIFFGHPPGDSLTYRKAPEWYR
jgi:4-pyridoxolactonase